jgi:hypothetical protein
MPERFITNSFDWIAALFAAFAALFGGVASYSRQIELGMTHTWSSAALHLFTSGFAGFLCWLGCLQLNVQVYITGVLAGLSGHMGAEFVRIIEHNLKQKMEPI